jgi:hypothetical protein
VNDDELRLLGEELRALLVEERRAIAKLDHERLSWLAEQKRHLAAQLATISPGTCSPAAKEILAAIKIEAQATAMLANVATEAVRTLLGREQTGYDRRARRTESSGTRLLVRY